MSNIRDVARLAGVSPATVSRILNNNTTYKLTADTRQRVLKAAAELNYHPLNKVRPKEQPASCRKLFRVGCILATTKGKYSDPYYLTILSGMEDEFVRQDCEISLIYTEQELANPAILQTVLDAGLDGLVLMRPLAPALFSLLRSRIPHMVGVDACHLPIDSIEYDHHHVSHLAVEYLYRKGHREIGFIGGDIGSTPMRRCGRFRGYQESMLDLELPLEPRWILNCQWDDKLCMKLVEKLYHSYRLPTAFYAASDLMAMALLRELNELHVPVPAQVAVIGMTNIEMSRFTNPPLTTINVPALDMGCAVAKTLAERIRNDRSMTRRIILPSELVERESV